MNDERKRETWLTGSIKKMIGDYLIFRGLPSVFYRTQDRLNVDRDYVSADEEFEYDCALVLQHMINDFTATLSPEGEYSKTHEQVPGVLSDEEFNIVNNMLEVYNDEEQIDGPETYQDFLREAVEKNHSIVEMIEDYIKEHNLPTIAEMRQARGKNYDVPEGTLTQDHITVLKTMIQEYYDKHPEVEREPATESIYLTNQEEAIRDRLLADYQMRDEMVNEEVQQREEEIKPNQKILTILNQYDSLEKEKSRLSRIELQQKDELAKFETTKTETSGQEYFDELDERNRSINAITAKIEDINDELAGLDKDLSFYSDDEVSATIRYLSAEAETRPEGLLTPEGFVEEEVEERPEDLLTGEVYTPEGMDEKPEDLLTGEVYTPEGMDEKPEDLIPQDGARESVNVEDEYADLELGEREPRTRNVEDEYADLELGEREPRTRNVEDEYADLELGEREPRTRNVEDEYADLELGEREPRTRNVEDEYADLELGEREPRTRNVEDEYADLELGEREPRTRNVEDEYVDLELGEREPRTRNVEDEYVDLDIEERNGLGREANAILTKLERRYRRAHEEALEAIKAMNETTNKLIEAYEEQEKRYETLINNNDSDAEYAEYLTEKKEEAEEKIAEYKAEADIDVDVDINVDEENKEEARVEEEIDIAKLEQETLDAQIRINELETERAKAIVKKVYFNEQELKIAKDIKDKCNELEKIVDEGDKALKGAEIEAAEEQRTFLIDKQNHYQSEIDRLQVEIAKNNELIEKNKAIIANREALVQEMGLEEELDDNDSNNGEENNVIETDTPDLGGVTPVGIVPEPEEEQEEPIEVEEPERVVVTEPEVETPEEPRVETRKGRNLAVIIQDIYTNKDTGEPIGVTQIQRKRLERSNISVTKNFANEVRNGNILYNVVSIAPAIIHLPISLFQKLSGKLLTTKRTRDNLEKIRQNIRDLPDEDKEVLFKKYKNASAFSDRAKGADGVIREEAMTYLREKEITPRVEKAGDIFAEAFQAYELYKVYQSHIDALEAGVPLDTFKKIPGFEMNIEGITREELLDELRKVQSKVVEGKAADIARFKKLNDELADLYSGGGLHGIEEEERAKSTKMNERGKRFATDIGTDYDWEGRQKRAEIAQGLDDALEAGLDKEALLLFVKGEQEKLSASDQGMVYVRILKGNPLIPQGIPILPAGIGEKGSINYMPIAQEMDYRPDPFIRNMITTVAAAATIAHAIGQIQHQIEINKANKANADIEGQIHARGKELESKQDELDAGMQHQREADFAARRNHDEMNDTYYNDTSNYLINDPKHHLELRDAYQSAQSQIEKIHSQIQSGEISRIEGLEQISQLNRQIHEEYVEALKEALPGVEKYAAEHPQYDYSVLIPSMRKMIENPSALDAENQALLESIQIGGELQDIAITQLPSNIIAPLIGIGGAALITGYAASQAQKGFEKQEDTLTDIVRDSMDLDMKLKNTYLYEDEEPEIEEPEEEYEEVPEEEFEEEELEEDEEIKDIEEKDFEKVYHDFMTRMGTMSEIIKETDSEKYDSLQQMVKNTAFQPPERMPSEYSRWVNAHYPHDPNDNIALTVYSLLMNKPVEEVRERMIRDLEIQKAKITPTVSEPEGEIIDIYTTPPRPNVEDEYIDHVEDEYLGKKDNSFEEIIDPTMKEIQDMIAEKQAERRDRSMSR